MPTDYPWSYDPLLMREYFEGSGYKPVYLRNTDDNCLVKEYDYVAEKLYGLLKKKSKLADD